MASAGNWSEAGGTLQIEYSTQALGHLRELAVDGLLALPRVGMGTGGLLMGVRDPDRLRILDSIQVPCSHAMGPSFALTAEETAAARELVRTAGPLGVVGCYFSKTRGWAEVSELELGLFQVFCPEPWQIMLLIRPSTVEESRVAVCFRNTAGKVVRGADRPIMTKAEPERAAEKPEPRAEKKAESPAAPAFTQLAGKNTVNWSAFATMFGAAVLVVAAIVLLLQFR